MTKLLFRPAALLICLAVILCGTAFGQVTTGTVLGLITDPADASAPNIEVQLKNVNTGDVRTFTTGTEGIFRFTNLMPGSYTVTTRAQGGFKAVNVSNFPVSAGESRDLGKIKLTLGAVTEEVTITASALQVQTNSAERSATINGQVLTEVAIKGRDMMSYLRLLPGVITGTNETASVGAIGSVNINGGGTGRNNFTVDGVSNLDTGSNGTAHYAPNLDSIGEIRVLTTNYQAEFGHMAGGQIAVTLKSGGQQFHGSLWENWRHEMLNAKNFFDNFNNNQKTQYRFNIAGFQVNGPITIPKLFNQKRERFFFMVSQEYTRQKVNTVNARANMPTAAERLGDFSNTFGTNNVLVSIFDPNTNRVVLPGNKLPVSLITPAGKAVMDFFPLPNRCDINPNAPGGCYTDGDIATQRNNRNYLNVYTPKYPRRNDTVKFDVDVSSKFKASYRFIRDYDMSETDAGIQLKNAKGEWETSFLQHPNPGKGHAINLTYTISPTTVNEFTFGKSYNTWSYYANNPELYERARMGNPASFVDFAKDPVFIADQNQKRPLLGPGALNYGIYIPNISFGAPNSTQTGFSVPGARPYTNWNDVWSINNSISHVRGKHSFKAGFYWEKTGKVQQSGTGSYTGAYSFGNQAAWAGDTNNGWGNALLGQFNSYSEGKRIVGDFRHTSVEFFVQDNWKVSRRLTLDYGIRMYHLVPQENVNNNTAVFQRSSYDPSKAARLYYPCLGSGKVAGIAAGATAACDFATGTEVVQGLSGNPVPFSVGGYTTAPNVFNGMEIADGNNPRLPQTLFTVPFLSPGIRLGIAYDVFGDGKTAIRTGFGQTYNRGDGNQIMGFAGGAPITFSRSLSLEKMANVPNYANASAPTPTPIGNGGIVGKQAYETSMNGSFSIQQDVGFGTVVETSYVMNLRRHNTITRQLNSIPLYSQFNPANQSVYPAAIAIQTARANDPVKAQYSGTAVADNFFRPLKGLGTVNTTEFGGSSNYHSMQVSIRKTSSRGISYGLAYTGAKTLNAGSSNNFADKFRNYGPSFNGQNQGTFGSPHVLVVNYVYSLPGVGKKLGLKPLGWITDNWVISGVTSWQSHALMGVPTPSFSTSTASGTSGINFTGSAEGVRAVITGKPIQIPNEEVTFNRTFAWENIGVATPCSWTNQNMACFGNAGPGSIVKVPLWMNNWDMTFSKSFNVAEKKSLSFRAEMFNIFNHTQFDQLNTGISYQLAEWQQGRLTPTANQQIGRYSRARTPRQMSGTLRFQF